MSPVGARWIIALLCWGTLLATRGVAASSSRDFLAARVNLAQKNFSELTALLGHGDSGRRLAAFQDALRPMFLGLPKNKQGYLEQGTARYALHRYFLAHRGWQIQGLAPDGRRWNETGSTEMLKEQVPSSIFELLEERIGRGHMGLQELSVLAATVEDIAHRDAVDLLNEVYDRLGLPTDAPLDSEETVELVLHSFCFLFLMSSYRVLDGTTMQSLLADAQRLYPGWQDTVLWARDVQETMKFQDSAVHNPFNPREVYFRDYSSMVRLVEHILDGMGPFQDLECNHMKQKLMDLEDEERSDGRVRLTRFYAEYMESGHIHFSESPGLLRHMGSLDEDSDPKRPSVIVPNFIYGQSNCLGISGGVNALCCMDHCFSLLEALEQRLGRPAAAPELLAQYLEELPSQTMAAPRNLSASLRRKLDGIAAQHGGLVPLHGRRFSQLMSHAYPNECARPRPLNAAVDTKTNWTQWELATHRTNRDEVEALHALAATAEDQLDPEALHEGTMVWTEEEDQLVAEHHIPAARDLRSPLLLLAVLGSGGAACAILWERLRSSIAELRGEEDKIKGTRVFAL